MKHRQPDIAAASSNPLAALAVLPRRVYGHMQGLPNQAIAERHSHEWMQLSYAAEGVIEVATDSGRYAAAPLCAVWIPAGVAHSVHCAPDTQIRSLYVASSALPANRRHCTVIAVAPLLRELIRAFGMLPIEYDEQGMDGRLVAVLLDQLLAAPEMGLSLPWPQDARLRRLCKDLHAHPDSRKSLADYSAVFSLSERTLSRLFLQQTGLTFRLWRQRSRLLASLPLLERGERVTDVALACGYDSMSAFIAAFREQMGGTPTDFFR